MLSGRPRSLKNFVDRLSTCGELVEVHAPVDPFLELSEIHRRVVQNNGPALLFTNVRGSSFPVATNLFSSRRRLHIAFGEDVEERVHQILHTLTRDFSVSLSSLWTHRRTVRSLLNLGTRKTASAPLLHSSITPVDLNRIPFIKCWSGDGGSFLTLPMVYTESPTGAGGNLGIYRIQRYDETSAGLHWQIAKGGGHHYAESESRGEILPVTIFLGGSPALIVSAIAPLPENVSELLLAAFLQESPVNLCRKPGLALPLIAECDAALVGYANPNERRLEGPFGDHYGYQSPALPFPVFHCTNIFHRKDAIIPATVVGRPLQEDAYIGRFVQSLLSPFVSLLVPSLKNIYTYPETGFHPLAVAQVHERHDKEAFSTGLRLLGEGQLALTKILMITDQPIPLDNISILLPAILERLRPEEDLSIFAYTSLDTLDMTGPKPNRGSKAIFIGTGEPRRTLPQKLTSSPSRIIRQAIPFTRGCLVVDGPSYKELPDPSDITAIDAFSEWR